MAKPTKPAENNTRAAILDAAAELFGTNGYDGVSLRDVASKVKLQVGSLYNHIKSKQELFVEILDQIWSEFFKMYESEVLPLNNPRDKLSAYVRGTLRRTIENRESFRLALSMHRPQYRPTKIARSAMLRVEGYEHEFVACLRSILDAGVRDGSFSISNTELSARAILGMTRDVFYSHTEDLAYTNEEIVSFYEALALRMVGAAPSRVDSTAHQSSATARRLAPNNKRRPRSAKSKSS